MILEALPAEIIAEILSYMVSVPDLLNIRLTSKILATHTVPYLRSLAFKNIQLPLDDLGRLEGALSHINDSTFATNVRWITINGIHDFVLPFYRNGTTFVDIELKAEAHSTLQRRIELLEGILGRLAKLGSTIDELVASAVTPKLLQCLMPAMAPDTIYPISGQPWRQQWYLLLAHTTDEVLAAMNLTTIRILKSLGRLRLPITELKLDGTILSLVDIEDVADAIKSAGGIQRLTLHLHEHLSKPAVLQVEIQRSADSLASALRMQLEQLVLSSTCRRSENQEHNAFLVSFLGAARLERLSYFHLEGFRVQSSVLLQFLQRHGNTIEQHLYDNFSFDGMDHLDDDEFEKTLNQGLSARGLSHLLVSSETSESMVF